MKYNILTSFNEKYWNEIAKENISLLDRHWFKDQEIFLYHQLKSVDKKFSSRVQWFDLYKTCPELPRFADTWKDHPKANGTYSSKPNMAFRYNAIKFAHKTFAIWHAAKVQNTGWLVWLDCDAIIFADTDENFKQKIFPMNKGICYLGRKGKYSECGFLAFNLDMTETKKFLRDWEDLYATGKFIDLQETHDSYTFDYLRLSFEHQNIFYDLNAFSTTDKNPFSNSLVNTHFVHAKGGDKEKTTAKLKKKLIKEIK